MGVTPIGLVVLPLGLYLFAKGRRHLFWATVWALPFYYVVALQLPFAPVRPFQYLAGLLMARYAIDVLLKGEIPAVRRSTTVLMAGLFLLCLVASLFMPFLLSTTVYVVPEGIRDLWRAYQNPVPLQFSVKNFTQLLYPTFGILLFLSIEWYIRSKADLKRVIRILVRAFYLVAAFMVVYQIAYLVNLRAPINGIFFLFTGEANANFSDYNALGNLIRAFTPVGEPGYTGTYFGMVLAIVAGLTYGGYARGWTLSLNRRLVVVILAAIILNASTTGFFAVVAVLASFLVVSVFRRQNRVKATSNARTVAQLLFGMVAVAVMALLTAQAFGLSLIDIIVSEHVAKIAGGAGSGAFRLTSIIYTMQEVFAKSPILGVGYGSHRALSLIVFLLANTGVVGLLTFLLFNGTALLHAVKAMNRAADPELASIAFALAVTHLSLLAVLSVKSDVALAFGWLWMTAALCEACYRLHRHRQRLASVSS
jgi:hypothetical protein